MVFEVPDLTLLGADYDLSLGAVDALEEGEPALERTVRFSVAHSDRVEGVVDLRGSWRSLAPAEDLR